MAKTEQHFCPRCARLGTEVDSLTERLWYCPSTHGVIYREPLAGAQTGGAPAAAGEAAASLKEKPKARALN